MASTPTHRVRLTGVPDADDLLSRDPFALVLGMMLDQQFPMERAFAGPATIRERFGSVEPAALAAADPDEFATLCAAPPAVHRYPGSMATRIQALAALVVEEYGGHVERLWEQAADGRDLGRRLRTLPGFGPQKAQIFVALLGKQLGIRPEGWQEAAGDYAEPGSYRSIADVVDEDSLLKVRAFKQEKKRAVRDAG